MISFYQLVEEMERIDEFGWEKKMGTLTKLKPSVFFPLRRAKKGVKLSWQIRQAMRNPEKAKNIFGGGNLPMQGKRLKSFLSTAYKASRKVDKRDIEAAKKAGGLKQEEQ